MENLAPLICGGWLWSRPLPHRFTPPPSPRLYASPAAAPPAPDAELWLVGLGFQAEEARSMADEEAFTSGLAATCCCLLEREELAEGAPAGWDVLGFGAHRIHTWWDQGLAGAGREATGATPGPHGLFRAADAAREVADWLNREDLGEPVIWRPVCLLGS